MPFWRNLGYRTYENPDEYRLELSQLLNSKLIYYIGTDRVLNLQGLIL